MGSSLVVDIGGVMGSGQPLHVDDSASIPAFAAFTFTEPAHVVLDLRRVDRGLQIDGSIDVQVDGPCDRCLEDVSVPIHIEVEERFDPPSGTSDPFAENNVLSGDLLDVGDLTRQLVTSALPMGFVCKDDCAGLCPQCGRNRNETMCTCDLALLEGDHGEP
jgi:uncharacterized protein